MDFRSCRFQAGELNISKNRTPPLLYFLYPHDHKIKCMQIYFISESMVIRHLTQVGQAMIHSLSSLSILDSLDLHCRGENLSFHGRQWFCYSALLTQI